VADPGIVIVLVAAVGLRSWVVGLAIVGLYGLLRGLAVTLTATSNPAKVYDRVSLGFVIGERWRKIAALESALFLGWIIGQVAL